MEYNTVCIFVMYYALFKKKLFSNDVDIIKNLPKNAFGVFSTIRRYRKLRSYPIDIHGCIGYWDTNFQTITRKVLYNNLLRVAYDSVWTDSRNTYFPPIESEPETVLEIDFMVNPIYSINIRTGMIIELNTLFTNKEFGIIIQTRDKTRRATYLPDVFPDISWQDIVISIKNKAGIMTNDFELFAYKIEQIKARFIDILTGELFTRVSVYNFSRILLDNMKLDLQYPFIYQCKNNILEWDSSDEVRNIASLGDIFRYINFYSDIATKREYGVIKQKIFNILQGIDRYGAQSLSFLGYIYKLFNIKNDVYCKKLLNALPEADDEFGRQEIIIGLNNSGCDIEEYELTYTEVDSIFKMNWVIQALVSYDRAPSNRLIIMLENKIDEILRDVKNVETNVIAVAFEALCYTYKKRKRVKVLDKMFELFFELEKRKTCYDVFYAFLDKSVRIDITGHILNGLVELNM